MSSYYRQQLEAWLKGLNIKADRVLDVGGTQLPVEKRVKSWDVQDYQVLDLPEPHTSGPRDLKWDLNAPLLTDPEPFDTVFCLEVMEYIWDPATALKNLGKFTAPGGTLYITFPYYYPPHEPLAQDALRYTLGGAVRLLAEGGFELQEMIPRRERGGHLQAAVAENGLRASRNARPEELYSLGFIIKAKRI